MINYDTRPELIHGDLDIQQVLGEMLVADSAQETAHLFGEIVDHADRADLQFPKLLQLQDERENYLAPFMANPYAAVVGEMALLGSLSQERGITSVGITQTDTEFVTRSASEDGIDALYHIVKTPSGKQLISIETRLQGLIPEPCYIEAGNDKLTMSFRRHSRGELRDVPLDLREGEKGNALLQAFFGSTIWAAHLAMTRTPDKKLASDNHAKELLSIRQRQV